MKRLNQKGFTLVEIMIVVAIIALLAAIAIPNLLRAKISANDALAQSTLRTLSTAAETYTTAGDGIYPQDETDMSDATPPYINATYCGKKIAGFDYVCTWGSGGYSLTATPDTMAVTGTTVFTMITGGILTN